MNNIKKIALEHLAKLKGSILPIDIEKIAKTNGVTIIYKILEDDISGFLYPRNNNPIIIVNENHVPTRQRFTIAHELGHYCLNHYGELFLDKDYILFRDLNSKDGSRIQEREANKFAAEILMPEDLLIKEISKKSFDFEDDSQISELASKFNVSTQALLIRLSNLGLNFM